MASLRWTLSRKRIWKERFSERTWRKWSAISLSRSVDSVRIPANHAHSKIQQTRALKWNSISRFLASSDSWESIWPISILPVKWQERNSELFFPDWSEGLRTMDELHIILHTSTLWNSQASWHRYQIHQWKNWDDMSCWWWRERMNEDSSIINFEFWILNFKFLNLI